MAEGVDAFGRLIHDLRSPLAVVEGFAQLLERDTGALTEEQRREFAARIAAAAAEMRAAVDQAASARDAARDAK